MSDPGELPFRLEDWEAIDQPAYEAQPPELDRPPSETVPIPEPETAEAHPKLNPRNLH